MAFTNAGHVQDINIGSIVDLPPNIISNPTPSFTEGVLATYDMTQHVFDDGLSIVAYALSNTLPSGLTFNQSTGLLSYDGVGGASVSQHQLTATDAVGFSTSASFNIDIVALGNQAWSYVGVPYVTDLVPSALMPILPTGADIQAFPYDPCTLAPPAHPSAWPSAEVANYYYIDRFHVSATDTGNSFGFPNQPRLTIPASARSAGVLYVEIHGNNNVWPGIGGSPDYDFDQVIITGVIGTASQPVFWYGVDAPWIGWQIEINSSVHFIFDNIHMMGSPGNQPQARLRIFPGCQYVTFRNGTVRGDGVGASAGIRTQMVDIAGAPGDTTNFICIYNNSVMEGGDWTQEFNRDVHGIRPLYWIRHVWVIENNIFHLQGDCIQMGNSANANTDPAQRSHYTYFAGNNAYDTWENAVDCKTSYHFICSGNDLWGTRAAILIFTNNAEGELTAYHWAINNTIRDPGSFGQGLRFSGDRVGQKTYVIGNWFSNLTSAIAHADSGGVDSVDEWTIHNTITNCTDAIHFPRGSSKDLTISGNITYNATTNHIESGASGYTGITALNYHLSFNTASATSLPTLEFDSAVGNLVSVDPLFTAPGSGDFTLQAGSPALGAVTTLDPVFNSFFSLYGVSIKTDIAGNPIPDTNADIGAYQRV